MRLATNHIVLQLQTADEEDKEKERGYHIFEAV